MSLYVGRWRDIPDHEFRRRVIASSNPIVRLLASIEEPP
jgi:hypothetical protein